MIIIFMEGKFVEVGSRKDCGLSSKPGSLESS
jgi:hypothetical protein